MSFELQHTFISQRFTPTRRTSGEQIQFTVDERGDFQVLFPGRLIRHTFATFRQRIPVPNLDDVDDTELLHGGFQTVTEVIPLQLRIFTPDGREFTANEITLADLRRFRDLRGSPVGMWSYRLTGKSDPITNPDSIISNAAGAISIGVIEPVMSESAPPLINRVTLTSGRRFFKFDLFRVGTFVADISLPAVGSQWRGSMRLVDPDGVAVASTTGRRLIFTVDLRTLNKSRDAAGNVREWRLELSPTGGIVQGSPRISATVIASGRITVASLKSRIEALLGKDDQQFVEIFGENKNGKALARLKITDVVSAESIDLYNLLEKAFEKVEQDPEVDPKNIEVNQVYTFRRTAETFEVSAPVPFVGDVGNVTLKIDCSTVKVDDIDVTIAPSVMIEGGLPAVKLMVSVSGAIKIKFKDLTLAEAKVRGGKFEMEIGIKLDSNGTPQLVTWLPNSPFDIDVSNAAIAVFLVTFPTLAAVIVQRVESKETDINRNVVESVKDLFSDNTITSRILMMIFGGHLTYKSIRFEGEEIVFEYFAPVEPELKPSPNYQGAIGRRFLSDSALGVVFNPRTLGDTWRADNLNKIDHIVVVMMENRSYDHVLGYRALDGISEAADGLTSDLIARINEAPNGPFNMRQLRLAGFAKNEARLMTRLPQRVGHETHDVQQQLSVLATGPNNRAINSPEGFVENFKPRLQTDPRGVVPDDVLGYYDEQDLAFFDFLAKHYAYCDRYFCSHPGPTQPNRMYSLTGDLQRDRYGFPIVDNNNGDNFLLSRVPNICDLLVRRGLNFRIYESPPSVTMLRMFARYATDNVNILALDQLEVDVKPGARGLPALTMIEPQMHAHPQDDDHPDADMLRGQVFLHRVYKALTSNPAIWVKTLLIITYDEHGGFYDHVIPPVADIYNIQIDTVARGNNGGNGTVTAATPTRLAIRYGVRVPTFVVSPWTMRGKGPSLTLDHCSILKTVLARFFGAEKPFFSDRVNASHSFNAFLTEAAPRMDVPVPLPPASLPLEVRKTLSPTSSIVTRPLSRQRMREGPVDFHALTGRWARQLGR